MRKIINVVFWALSFTIALFAVSPLLLGWVVPSLMARNIRRKRQLKLQARRQSRQLDCELRLTIEDRMAEIEEEFKHLKWAGNGEAKVPINIRLPNFLDRLVEAFIGILLVFRITRRKKARAKTWRGRGVFDD